MIGLSTPEVKQSCLSLLLPLWAIGSGVYKVKLTVYIEKLSKFNLLVVRLLCFVITQMTNNYYQYCMLYFRGMKIETEIFPAATDSRYFREVT